MKTRTSQKSLPTTVSLTVKDTADDAPTHFIVRANDHSFHVKTIERLTGASFRGYANQDIKNIKPSRIWISPNEAIDWITTIDETLGGRLRQRLEKQLGHHVDTETGWTPTELMMREHRSILDRSKNIHQVIYGYQLGPNLIKIGRSDLGVARRIRDLSILYKGNLIFVVPVKNPTMVERGIFDTKEIRNRRTIYTNSNHQKTTEVIKLDDKFGVDQLLKIVKKAKLIFDNPTLNTLYM